MSTANFTRSITQDSQQLVLVIDECIKFSREQSSDYRAQLNDLDEARKLAMRARLSLVILGGEGHGKSTLINAITSTNIVPTSHFEPGTVAPILLEWGPSTSPTYQVVIKPSVNEGSNGHATYPLQAASDDESGITVECKSSDEFGTYLLQRHNKDNKKGVRRGTIRVDHALLGQGLRLIDMPGVAGVSGRVAEEAVAFVRQDVYAAIALVRNREYAPLIRLLELLPRDKLRIEAVICNRDGDFWDEFPNESALHDEITQQRNVLATALKAEGVIADPRNTFVLHLPSMKNLASAKSRGPTGESHEKEITRFSSWLRGYMTETRLQTRNAAATATERVVNRLIEANDEHEMIAHGIREGRKDAFAKAQTLYTDGGAYVRDRWRQAKADPALSHLKNAYWQQLTAEITTARSSISTAIGEARSRVRYASSFGYDDAKAVNKEIERVWNEAIQPIRQIHGDQVEAYFQKIYAIVSGIFIDSRRIFPLLRGDIEWEKVIYQMLMQFGPGDTNANGFMEFFLDKRIGNRVLDHYEAQLARIDTVANGSQSKLFRESFELIENAFGTQIDKWLGKHWTRIFGLGQQADGFAAIAKWAGNIRDKMFQVGLHGDLIAVLEEKQQQGQRLRLLRDRLRSTTLRP